MSVENFRKFVVMTGQDKDLEEKVKAAGTDVNALIDLGKGKGCEFTAQDMKDAYDQEVGDKELSDEELENVAGGFVSATAAVVAGAVGAAAAVTSSSVAVATTAHA